MNKLKVEIYLQPIHSFQSLFYSDSSPRAPRSHSIIQSMIPVYIFFFSSIDVYLYLIPVLTVGRIANGCITFIGLCWCCRCAEPLSQSQIISICNRLLDMSCVQCMTTGFIHFFPSWFLFWFHFFGKNVKESYHWIRFAWIRDFFFPPKNGRNQMWKKVLSECCRINFNHNEREEEKENYDFY